MKHGAIVLHSRRPRMNSLQLLTTCSPPPTCPVDPMLTNMPPKMPSSESSLESKIDSLASVNDSLLSWASTMDFICSLNASLFAFTEPNLQWDRTLLHEATTLQCRFFSHGQLVTSESALRFSQPPANLAAPASESTADGPHAQQTVEWTRQVRAAGHVQ
jgi:hypothetical protein